MAWQKIYSISGNVTSGVVIGHILRQELNDGIGSVEYVAVLTAGDVLTVIADVQPSAGVEIIQDQIVADHTGVYEYNPAESTDIFEVSASTPFSTSSDNPVLISQMTLSPGAGNYLAVFNCEAKSQTSSDTSHISIFQNGVQKISRRIKNNDWKTISIQAMIYNLGDGEAIEARVKSEDSKTTYVENRTLTVMRIA